MSIRLVVDGRGALRKRFLDQIVELSAGRVSVGLHFGDRDGDFHAACLQRMERRDGKRGHLLQDHLSRGANIPLLSSPEFRWIVEQSIEQMHRDGPNYRYRGHNLQSIQDYLDYFHILADAYSRQIVQAGATHALFLNMPHLGYDVVLYHVARVMGLKTLLISQTFFADSYFSMERIEEFGWLNPDAPKGAPQPIEKGSAPEIFYMDPRWQEVGPRGRIGAKAVLQLLRQTARSKPAALLNPRYIFGNLRRMQKIYGGLPDWRDPFSNFFHENELAYFEHLAEFEAKPVDLNAKFVYMPLHNQPEMSTQTLGGVFRDQLLAVEAVGRSLPDGWKIYVKENPRQSGYARGPMFFHRLSRIAGVQFVPSETSTHELSTRAQLTATVGSNAGWEAIRKGKPVLVFGNPWYGSLPGVVRWQDGIDLEAVARHSFAHEALEAAVGNLSAACHPGVIEGLYVDRTPDLDHAANVNTVAQTVLDLLEGRRAPTFKKVLAAGNGPNHD